MARFWTAPEGVRIQPDGTWSVGGLPIVHSPSLRYLKAHLVFEEHGTFIVRGAQRMTVAVEGPAFEVVSLVLDAPGGEARVRLDDGSEEILTPESLSMSEQTGRFECLARDGRARAIFSRGAHQTLLDNIVEGAGGFFLCVGSRRIPVRT